MDFHHRRAAVTIAVLVLFLIACMIAAWPWSAITVATIPIAVRMRR
jgi:hypothetical protein